MNILVSKNHCDNCDANVWCLEQFEKGDCIIYLEASLFDMLAKEWFELKSEGKETYDKLSDYIAHKAFKHIGRLECSLDEPPICKCGRQMCRATTPDIGEIWKCDCGEYIVISVP